MEILLRLDGCCPPKAREGVLDSEVSPVSPLEVIFYDKSNGWNSLAAFLV